MPDDDLQPDPQAADFFAKYVISCARLGVTPVNIERARELLAEWADTFASRGERRNSVDRRGWRISARFGRIPRRGWRISAGPVISASA